MLNITYQQGNENQNYHGIITSHLSEWLKSTAEDIGVGEAMEKGAPSYTVGGDATGAPTPNLFTHK